ncbi:hypothetical protein HOD83_03950 [Candidatus Woesearchaeota archaeon]|jgi:hypothetical protein|nr:hypothetical protein [Candidatus Woesearchaeota archaeon]MBT4114240.1 hypothetical protein [Candidatus Woesearchaeota archaeon]MBT4248702.1 hypothetical protein [Candidatus Woesearchaeota archaeon]
MILKLLTLIFVITLIFNVSYAIDTDGDGLDDLTEATIGTRENSMDTDEDGFSDGVEVEFGSDPLNVKSSPENQITGFSIRELPMQNYLIALLVVTIISQVTLFFHVSKKRKGDH